MADGDLAGSVVGHHHGDGVGRNPAGALVLQLGELPAEGGEAANAGTEVDTQPLRIDLAGQSGVLHGLHRSGHSIEAERIIPANKGTVHGEQGIEILDLCCQSGLIVGGIKFGDGADAVFARQQAGPGVGNVVAHGSDGTQSGHYDSSHPMIFLSGSENKESHFQNPCRVRRPKAANHNSGIALSMLT